MAERINALVDAALEAERAATPPRDYLGASRLGHACERALQFEFAGAPKDEGQDFSGRSLRIFAIGHELEDLAIRWLRAAGLDLVHPQGSATAASSASPSRAGASAAMSTGSSPRPRRRLDCAPRRSGNARR